MGLVHRNVPIDVDFDQAVRWNLSLHARKVPLLRALCLRGMRFLPLSKSACLWLLEMVRIHSWVCWYSPPIFPPQKRSLLKGWEEFYHLMNCGRNSNWGWIRRFAMFASDKNIFWACYLKPRCPYIFGKGRFRSQRRLYLHTAQWHIIITHRLAALGWRWVIRWRIKITWNVKLGLYDMTYYRIQVLWSWI